MLGFRNWKCIDLIAEFGPLRYKKNYINMREDRIHKSGIRVAEYDRELCNANSHHRNRLFYPYLTLMLDSYILLTVSGRITETSPYKSDPRFPPDI